MLFTSMLSSIRLLPSAIADLFADVTLTGEITLADRYGLLAAILEDAIGQGLEEEERQCINRILRSFRRGHLKIVNRLSHP